MLADLDIFSLILILLFERQINDEHLISLIRIKRFAKVQNTLHF